MEHELSHSPSEQSIASERSHRPTNGYEICVHTCTQELCISRKTNTILWNKEGHAVRKHACSARKHPDCGEGVYADCPGWQYIGKKQTRAGGRDATNAEVSLHLGIPYTLGEEVPQVELEEDVVTQFTVDHTPIMAAGPSTGDSRMAVDRRFKILYIPDAAMRIHSKEKAQNDLGFIPATLSEAEYEPLKNLIGSIHVISRCRTGRSNIVSFKVVMQEWVSAYNWTTFII
jgi:hypothetical protein